ncbi:MAG: hypothetical protein QOK28_2197 [Actinomycetota bacterium]|jgi:hypothetical protein
MHTPSLPGFTEVLVPKDDHVVDRLIARARTLLNKATRGRVEVDYDTRTVVFKHIDGEHALRLLALVEEHDEGNPASARWADQLDPRTSNAGCRWITFRPDRVLSIRWFPERVLIEDDAHRARIELAIALLDNLAEGAVATDSDVDDDFENDADDNDGVGNADGDDDSADNGVVDHGDGDVVDDPPAEDSVAGGPDPPGS